MVAEPTKKLNFFPPKGGVSQHYSPRQIVLHKVLDYDKECRHTLGSYVQADDDPKTKNSMKARTLDCIYLRPTGSPQGGHQLLHLATGEVITRGRVTEFPVTESVIKLVHHLAELEGVPKGLKIASKTGVPLYDAAWIAGVDYTTDSDSDTDSDSEDDDSEEEDDNESNPSDNEEDHDSEDDSDDTEDTEPESVRHQKLFMQPKFLNH
jgi:hypothetical protein